MEYHRAWAGIPVPKTRHDLEVIVEQLITLLDAEDGDPDLEDGLDAEPGTWTNLDTNRAQVGADDECTEPSLAGDYGLWSGATGQREHDLEGVAGSSDCEDDEHSLGWTAAMNQLHAVKLQEGYHIPEGEIDIHDLPHDDNELDDDRAGL